MRAAFIPAAFLVASCATNSVDLPSNATASTPDRQGLQTIESLNYERAIEATGSELFSAARRCAVTNLSHDAVALSGTNNTFIGPFTGQVYRSGSTSTIEGSDTLILAVEEDNLVVARAQTDYPRSFTTIFVRFRLITESEDAKISIQARDIQAAFQSTGSIRNTGFTPIGTWPGAQPLRAIEAINGEVDQYLACIENHAG